VGKDSKIGETLRSCESELNKAKRVIKLLERESTLQTLTVVAGIETIKSHVENLGRDIPALRRTHGTLVDSDNKRKTSVTDIFQTDPSSFTKSVGNLRDTRKDLMSQIRRAAVGLEKTEDGTKWINTKAVNSTDRAVRDVFGFDCGLTIITAFVSRLGRQPDSESPIENETSSCCANTKPDIEDGKIKLTKAEYQDFTLQQARADDPDLQSLPLDPKARTRIISNCLARDQSLSFLGPVGVDIWKDMSFVKVEGVVSMNSAIVVGYAQTKEFADEVLASRERILIAVAAAEKRRD
jgi:hypothetical protein